MSKNSDNFLPLTDTDIVTFCAEGKIAPFSDNLCKLSYIGVNAEMQNAKC